LTANLQAELLGHQQSRLIQKSTAWEKNFAKPENMYSKSVKIAEYNQGQELILFDYRMVSEAVDKSFQNNGKL